MANKMKKISVNALEQAVAESAPDNYTTLPWRGLEVVVKRRLGFQEMMEFVHNITQLCFSEGGEYIPEVKDFAAGCSILDFYTNITLPSNIEKRYQVLLCCDLIDEVMRNIDRNQLDAMLRAVDDKVDNLAQAQIEAATAKLTEVYTSLDEIRKSISSLFSGVSAEDMTKLASALSGGIDEKKLMDAYLETAFGKGSDKEVSD